jgi:hypothetical protein
VVGRAAVALRAHPEREQHELDAIEAEEALGDTAEGKEQALLGAVFLRAQVEPGQHEQGPLLEARVELALRVARDRHELDHGRLLRSVVTRASPRRARPMSGQMNQEC